MVSRISNLVLLAGTSILLCFLFEGCAKLDLSSPRRGKIGECVKIPPNTKMSKPIECCEILEKYHYLMGESALTEFHRATSEIRK